MGSFLGSAVFSASAFFYCLGLIFAVVGYIGAWLEPREGGNLAIQALSVRTVCFIESGYTFPSNVDSRSPPFEFNKCYDSTKTSEQFQELDPKYVSPGWYRMIQDMHLTSLILVFLIFMLLFGFLIAYCSLKQQIKKRQRPSSTLILSKAALGLWFILSAVAGALLVAEPIIFFKNYDIEEGTFFLAEKRYYKYGPGFAITIAGGVCLQLAALLGLCMFITVVKKMCKLSSGDARDEFDNMDARDTEMERLSNDELDSGNEETKSVTHKKAYPVAAPRKAGPSSDNDERSYQNIPKRRSEAAPTPTVEEQGPSYTNVPRARPQPAKRLSQHGSADNKPSSGYLADYGPPQNQARDPMSGNRSIAGESMASTAYPPSTHYSSHYSPHMGGREQYSDTESQRSGMRNKSVVRAADSGSRLTDNSNVPPPTVVQPGHPGNKANSRYASMY